MSSPPAPYPFRLLPPSCSIHTLFSTISGGKPGACETTQVTGLPAAWFISLLHLVQLDCGLHLGKKGGDALPYTDLVDAEEVDLILITHFRTNPI